MILPEPSDLGGLPYASDFLKRGVVPKASDLVALEPTSSSTFRWVEEGIFSAGAPGNPFKKR